MPGFHLGVQTKIDGLWPQIRKDVFDKEPIDQERPDKLKDFIPDAFRNNRSNRVDIFLV
jgi:hypothetical protein